MILSLVKLCNLSSEHKFLSFLYELDKELFTDYRMNLIRSTGCRYNQNLMESLIGKLAHLGYSERFEKFILDNYPDCLSSDIDTIFPDYDPSVITLPHRKIVSAAFDISGFCKDKHICKYLFIREKLFIEYLSSSEANLAPRVSWILDNYSDSKTYNQI